MTRKVCLEPGCPTITDQRRCPKHTRANDKARGTRQQRGYDAVHDQLRAAWQRRMDRGEHIQCTSPTCLTPEQAVDPNDWHLGHDEHRQHRGPEHPACNLTAAGRISPNG